MPPGNTFFRSTGTLRDGGDDPKIEIFEMQMLAIFDSGEE
jgi:hypothetical protein